MPSVLNRVLLRNGHVYTPDQPTATSMLTVGSRVAWIGPDAAAEGHRDTADSVVDLGGRLVTPGFVDAHAHVSQTGFALSALDLSGCESLDAALS